MIVTRILICALLVVLVLGRREAVADDSSSSTSQAEQVWWAGYRVAILTAGGEPANDITASAGYVQYRLANNWILDLSLQYAEYDFASALESVGYGDSSGADIEPRTRVTSVNLAVENGLGKQLSRVRPFLMAGLGMGYAVIDDIEGFVGTQPVNIQSEGGMEGVLLVGGGLHVRYSRCEIECGLKLERHFADWDVEDRITGQQSSVDDYSAWGGWLGLSIPL